MSMDERKVLGVLGGMGPMSSVFFYELVTENTEADTDQEHVDMIISSRATVPDRTAFILGESDENPLPIMKEEAMRLVNAGCTTIAMTCNTAHYFYEELQKATPVPILNIGRIAVDEIERRGIKKVGLLATTGTVRTGIYQKACEEKGIECIAPDDADQKIVMDIIYNQVKAGKRVNMQSFADVSGRLLEKGAEILILGCTELSVIRRTESLGSEYIDPLYVLARECVKAAGRKLVD
ncbi:MAG: amino acid racemase [Clostridia bacterium]|nr:amino acid racemase [Clostridia bacterium]